MMKSYPNGQKTPREKKKLLATSNFSYSHSAVKRLVLQTHKSKGLFKEGFSNSKLLSSSKERISLECTIRFCLIDVEWTRYRFNEYYVNLNELAFEESQRFCKEQLNATLVFFYTPGLYIRIVREGLLNISSGSLWVACMYKSISWVHRPFEY